MATVCLSMRPVPPFAPYEALVSSLAVRAAHQEAVMDNDPTRSEEPRRPRSAAMWWATGALGLGTVLFPFHGIPTIENHLTDKIEVRLDTIGESAATVEFSGQDGRICGLSSPTVVDKATALASAYGVHTLNVCDKDLATWRANRSKQNNGGSADTAGNEGAGDTADDADGSKDSDSPGTDGSKSGSGTANDAVAATMKLFRPAAEFDSEGLMTLTGTVPSELAHLQLVQAARNAVGADKVRDQLTVTVPTTPSAEADGVVTSAFTSLGSIIEAMPKNLVSGVAKVTDDGLKLTGIYVSEEQKSAFEAVATAAVPSDGATPGTAPAGSTDEGTGGTQKAADSNNPLAPLATDLSPRPVATEEDAAAVQARLNEVLAGRVIPFAPGSAALLPEAQPILQEVSAAAKQFAGLRISVDGHTDSDGADAANQALSQARAESVLSALIADGVPAEQLTAIGYGETQPLVPNDSPANKAQNRRVVFTVGKA